jgi:FtsZ-binding cell division protein ZapB
MSDYVQHVLEIEEIKKEHDKLMMDKITKYENEIAELKEDNKKLAQQIQDKNNLVGRLRDKGLI